MKNLILLLLAASTSSLAIEINLVDSNGNVLEDICGSKRNPDLKSIHTYIPYTQEECDRKVEFKKEKERIKQWRQQVEKPLADNLNKSLKETEVNYRAWVNNNRKALQNEYSKSHFLNVHFLHAAYVVNIRNVFLYYVHANSGVDGANEFIKWFNKNGGFDLNEWKEVCGNYNNEETIKWIDCKGEAIKGSEHVQIEFVNPLNKTQFRDAYIYFGKNKL